MDIIRLMLLSRQMKKRRHEKNNMVTGIPPLTFTAKKTGTLKNYRIYGGTVNGESVGDRTENLFDGIIGVDDKIIGETGGTTPNNEYAISEYIPVEPNMSYTYHFYHNNIAENRKTYSITEYDRDKNLIQPMTLHNITEKRDYVIIFTTRSDTAYIRINWKKPYDEDLMLNEGSTALPYEPYGYKVPVTVSNGTDAQTIPIYLSEQIRKVGDEAEYIDYAEQKMHRIGADDIDVTLPALPTLSGTNTLSVGTEVQPSRVELTGRIKEGES